MLKNKELLDFEIDLATKKTRILDAPEAEDALLVSLGLGGPQREAIVERALCSRCISSNRDDITQVLDAFGARSAIELAFMGHGLSLTDKLWYRAPSTAERWEDINFYDNDWDDTYRASILTLDYKKLASCSPDVPDITTSGHLRKAWERTEDCIRLVKEPLFENGYDLQGALLGAELCRRMYGQNDYQPLYAVERFGRRFSASPLMIGRDEELVQNARLFAMGGFDANEAKELMGAVSPQNYVNVLSRIGMANASEHAAKMFAFKALALLADIHTGNFGIIRNCETGEYRVAPPFDYDRAFGFPYKDFPFERLCDRPQVAALLCAYSFSDLDSSWDWSWYDPQALEGFEELIREAYAPFHDMPSRFGELVAHLFIIQRDYVNGIAIAR